MADDSATAVPLQPLVERIERQWPDALGIWVFGSVAHGTARRDSDLDLAVLCKEPVDAVELFDVGLELGVLAGRDVDLVDLRRAPLGLQKEVLCLGRPIVRRDEQACAAFAANVLALYVAFREELAHANRGLGIRS